jgi:hypothetical protein
MRGAARLGFSSDAIRGVLFVALPKNKKPRNRT